MKHCMLTMYTQLVDVHDGKTCRQYCMCHSLQGTCLKHCVLTMYAFLFDRCKTQATHLLPLHGKQTLKAWHAASERTLTINAPLQGHMTVKPTGDTQYAAAWQNERLVAVTFPTAATFAQLRKLAQGSHPHRLMIVITSQWETGHQVASGYVTSL